MTAGGAFDRAEVVRRFGRPRSTTVVFTNGVFDLIHRGHVDYLERSRELGDVLVVGVNTDASVRRLGKGADRPLNRAEDRAGLVAALRCVDAVCLFGEDTPLELIEALLPDVLVKGGDYEPDEVVGRAVVEGDGGYVKIVPLMDGYSTTALIRRIRGQDDRPT